MIETAFDEINLGNKPRRWIAAAFATCGQDPWSANLDSFEKHLASLNENANIFEHARIDKSIEIDIETIIVNSLVIIKPAISIIHIAMLWKDIVMALCIRYKAS